MRVSLGFFVNDWLWTIEMMLDKLKIRVIFFFFEFKMGHKAVETTCNTNNRIWPRNCWWTYSAVVVQEDEECISQPLGVDSSQLRSIIEAVPLKLREKLPKNSASIILCSFGTWSRLERWKSLKNRCLLNWPIIKKNCHFELSSSLIVLNNSEPFLDWIVTCDK